MTTRDIRIARLEGKVQTIEDVQMAILSKLDTVIANQDALQANQVKLIGLIEVIMQELADIKSRVYGRPMGFIQDDEEK